MRVGKDAAMPTRTDAAAARSDDSSDDAAGPVTTPAVAATRFWRALLLVVLAGIGLRVGYVLTVTQHDHALYDAAFYELEARTLADGRGFVYPLPGPQAAKAAADHPPLTALALVPAAELPGDSQLWMRFTMVLLGIGVVVLVGLLGNVLAGERAGIVAAALAAVYANLWMNDGLLMSETLAALTTVAALLLAYLLLRRRMWPVAAALDLVCGMAALTRAELALLVPLLAVPAAWLASPGRLASRLRTSGAVLGGAVLVVAPWVGFNLARFSEPAFLSTGDGPALLGANCAQMYHGPLLGLWSLQCVVGGASPRRPVGDRPQGPHGGRRLRPRPCRAAPSGGLSAPRPALGRVQPPPDRGV
jgi:4-amino-4-deoxy-L-arabinose transferase-like glycosyltransferase